MSAVVSGGSGGCGGISCIPAGVGGGSVGLLTVAAGQNVLRLVPPLIATEADIGEALQRLQRAALRCMPHDSLIDAK